MAGMALVAQEARCQGLLSSAHTPGAAVQRWPAVACLTLNALVWGVSWWPFRELQSMGVHPLWATALIYCFAWVCVLALSPHAWRGLLAHPALLWLALASGMTNVGFNWAVTVGDVVRVVLLFYLMPAWSVLVAWWLLGEKPTAASLLRLALSLAGVLLVLRPDPSAAASSRWPDLADALALFGGLSFALTNALLLKFRNTPSQARMFAMFAGGGSLALVTALAGGVQGAIAGLPPPNMAWILTGTLLAVAFLAGNLALQFGAARLPASTTALVMLSEVVFASASSVALGAAELAAHTVLGGALILASAVWAAWPVRR